MIDAVLSFFFWPGCWRLRSSFNIFCCLLGVLGAVFPWVLRGPPPRPPPLRLPRPCCCCCCCCCCWCCCCLRSRGSSGFPSRLPPPLGAAAALHPALLCFWAAPPGAPSPRFLATSSHPAFFPTPPRRLGLLAPATWIGYRGGLHSVPLLLPRRPPRGSYCRSPPHLYPRRHPPRSPARRAACASGLSLPAEPRS